MALMTCLRVKCRLLTSKTQFRVQCARARLGAFGDLEVEYEIRFSIRNGDDTRMEWRQEFREGKNGHLHLIKHLFNRSLPC